MTKLFVSLLFAICVLGSAESSGKRRPRPCTDSDHPVCATDGIKSTLFKNECHLRTENVKRQKEHAPKLEKVDITQCFTRCEQLCSDEYAPLCAVSTSGEGQKRFQNRCEFDLENCQHGNVWKVFHEGECPEPQVKDDCPEHCSLEINPVCGILGDVEQTFQNLCFLKTDICVSGRKWEIKNHGECNDGEQECYEFCPQIYSPVCAKLNGETKTFSNECVLDYEICTTKKQWDVQHRGECVKATEECLRPCAKIYDPICASNGLKLKTFASTCLLEVEICTSNEEWHILYEGECEIPEITTQPTICPDVCPAIYQPVCAIFNGYKRTFSNACALNIEKCNTKRDWKQISEGECTPITTQPPLTEKPNMCPDTCGTRKKPVCAAFGDVTKTFLNECKLRVECCKTGIDWKILFEGPCEDEYKVEVKNAAVKICPTVNEPVCANCNGENRTFTNKCQMDIENNKSNNDCKLVAHGECEESHPPVQPTGACPRCSDHYHPICATLNGEKKTFTNECYMITANCYSNETWEIESLHECDKPPLACPLCSTYYHPVCGYDENRQKTFTNECQMISENCYSNTNWTLKNDGECIEPNKECDGNCPEIYSPVCANLHGENKTFTNECILEYEICKSGHLWNMTAKGECQEPVKECNKLCSKIYQPICAKRKGQLRTFTNKCELEVESCFTNEKWDVKYDGECKVPVEQCNKACPFIFMPVCAEFKGVTRTFSNECLVKAEKCETKEDWKIIHDGECSPTIPPTPACPEVCPAIYKPVCGVLNGSTRTFSNSCELQVEACRSGEGWKEMHEGECEPQNPYHATTTPTTTTAPAPTTTPMPTTLPTSTQTSIPTTTPSSTPTTTPTPITLPPYPITTISTPEDANCPKECSNNYEPVCASFNGNMHTFSNPCELKAECCKSGADWKMISEGPCDDEYKVQVKNAAVSICPTNFDPVCAVFQEAKRTFSNKCQLKAHITRTKEAWEIVGPGECETQTTTTIMPPEICPTCTDFYEPVCGLREGEQMTFTNYCHLLGANCNSDKKWIKINDGVCKPTNQPRTCPNICPITYNPVCATHNGVKRTFPNECELNHEAYRTGNPWVFLSMGECDYCPPCSDDIDPVCAEYNGEVKTFHSNCKMEYENCKNGTKWIITSKSLCESFNCPKFCQKIYSPICASNNGVTKTFGNLCEMRVEACNNKQDWKQISDGECPDPNCPLSCTMEFSPVCAKSEGTSKTFINECLLRSEMCKTKIYWDIVHPGSCNSKTEVLVVDSDEEETPEEFSNSELLKMLLKYIRSNLAKPDSKEQEEEVKKNIPTKIIEG